LRGSVQAAASLETGALVVERYSLNNRVTFGPHVSAQHKFELGPRALLADPQIFVMDEATSSIDTGTEQLIQQGMANMLAGRISFVIAHLLSTIRRADRILVITKGLIEESGTHEELLRRRGHYYELYTHQFRREREQAVLESGA